MRDFDLILKEVCPIEKDRLRSIWKYWESAALVDDANTEAAEDGLHPDHAL